MEKIKKIFLVDWLIGLLNKNELIYIENELLI